MSFTIGVVLAAACVIFFAWGYAQHRRAHPARWTRSEFLSSSFSIALVALVPAAIGAMVDAAFNFQQTLAGIGLWGVGAMAVAVFLAVRLTPRLIAEGRTGSVAEILPFPAAPTTPTGHDHIKRAA